MKKEKTIRTYQRKTKSGKITTVKSHTAKYDAAAEVAKKAARKKGAGGELQAKLTKMPDPKLELQQYLDELKKSRSGASSDTTKTTKSAPKKKLKKPVGGGITGLEPKETKKVPAKKQTKSAPKSSGLSSTEFKAWYHDPKSKEGRAAAKKLKEQVGAEKYKELNKEANDNYSSRGHLSMFKRVGGGSTAVSKASKSMDDAPAPKTSSTGAKTKGVGMAKSDDKPYGFSYVGKNGKYVTKYFKTKAAMNSFKKRSKDVVTSVAYMDNSGRSLSDVSREEMISHIRQAMGYNNKQAQSFVDNLSTPGYLNLAREISKKGTSSKRR